MAPRSIVESYPKLYNERPARLRHAHERLDRAMLAAYAVADPDGAN